MFTKYTAPWKKQEEYGCYSWVNHVQLLLPTRLINKGKFAAFYGNCYNKVIVTSRVCYQKKPESGGYAEKLSKQPAAGPRIYLCQHESARTTGATPANNLQGDTCVF